MFESLRAELEGRNVGVSIFCPGLVRTDIFNTDRNRPASHGARAAPKPPPLKPGAVPVDLMGVAMDPLEAGEQVLAGLRRNDLYILSHPEFKPAARERFQLMMESFSTKPVPAGRRLATETFTPDIYAADLAKRRAHKSGRSRSKQKKKVSRAKPARRPRRAARRPR